MSLTRRARELLSQVFVNAPYDQYVKANTRFWNASGIDLTMDASGLKLNTQSLASILIGGMPFRPWMKMARLRRLNPTPPSLSLPAGKKP